MSRFDKYRVSHGSASKHRTYEFITDRIDIVAAPHSKHQVEHKDAIISGLSKYGINSKWHHSSFSCRARTVVVWGWRCGKHFRDRGHDVMVMERGYIGDRLGKWSALMLNGLNGRAGFPVPKDDGGARFMQYHADLYKPWNPDGDYVLLIGQVDGDSALQGKDLGPWYQRCCDRIRATGQRCVFRQHPQEAKRGIVRKVSGAHTSNRTLEEDLAGASLVVTWNSNTAVDAMLAGKPIVAEDHGSMAYSVAEGNSIEQWQTSEPKNRFKWASDLAWCQWTLDEIRDGSALEGFLLGLENKPQL